MIVWFKNNWRLDYKQEEILFPLYLPLKDLKYLIITHDEN